MLSNALEAIPDLSHTIFALADVSTSETSGLDYRREGVLCRGDGGISVVSKVGGLEAEGEDMLLEAVVAVELALLLLTY